MPVCLQWNHVLKRTQLHYIYNCVASSSQLPACLLVVAHVSILCVLISVLKYAALKKVDVCPFPLLTKPHPSRDFPRLLLWFNEGSCSDMLGSLQENVWPAGDQAPAFVCINQTLPRILLCLASINGQWKLSHIMGSFVNSNWTDSLEKKKCYFIKLKFIESTWRRELKCRFPGSILILISLFLIKIPGVPYFSIHH